MRKRPLLSHLISNLRTANWKSYLHLPLEQVPSCGPQVINRMDDATSVNLLQRVLDIIVYHQKITNAKNDDNGSCSSSIIELYPLSDQPNIQFVPKQIYKKHIHGLLFALKILYRYGESFRIANAKVHDCYNRHFQNQPYSLEINKLHKFLLILYSINLMECH